MLLRKPGTTLWAMMVGWMKEAFLTHPLTRAVLT
jgi:hypothetical protein